MSVERKVVISAIRWTVIGRVLAQSISWATTLIIIRFLLPSDYGVMALAEVFFSFMFMLTTAGFGDALVQAEDADEAKIRSFLGFLVLLSLAVASVQILLSSQIAAFFNEPEVREVLIVLAINIILTPWVMVSASLYRKELNFKLLTQINIICATFASLLSLAFAYYGAGVWALVIAMLVNTVMKVLIFCYLREEVRILKFDFRRVKSLISFGATISFASLMWAAYFQVDIFLSGRFYETKIVGIYAVAVFVASLPMTKLMPLINQVSFPIFTRIKGNSQEIHNYVLKSISAISIVTFPLFMGLAMVSAEFSVVVLGDQWQQAALYLSIVCFAMPFRLLGSLLAPAVEALGHVEVLLMNAAFNLTCFSLGVLVGVQLGIYEMCLSWLITSPIGFLFNFTTCNRILSLPKMQVAKSIMPAVFACSVMCIGVYAYKSATIFGAQTVTIQLITSVFLGAVLYFSALLGLFREHTSDLMILLKGR